MSVPASEPTSLFEPVGELAFQPTVAADGPWVAGVLHGGAVAALLTGLLEDPSQILSRVLVELMAPAPATVLTAEVGPTEGGRRVVRQTATLFAGERPVARAHALRMRRGTAELPPDALVNEVVFDPAQAPDLSRANPHVRASIGRPSFDSLAVATRWGPVPPSGPKIRRLWISLLLPVLADRPATPVQKVVAAADFGSAGTAARLDFDTWTFRNADLIVGFGRDPVGNWVGLESEGLLGPEGTGQSSVRLHDAAGPLGQATQSLLLEPR